MAYQIDFTASNYERRKWRKIFLRALLATAVAAAVWGVHDCYVAYNQPTLNMRLAEYEAVARPIEEMSAKWDGAAKEYGAMARYYRLVWAANATNFLSAMVSESAPRLERGFHPTEWLLATGGDCVLTYRYAFGPGDKAGRAKGLEDQVVHMITSVVEVVGGRVDVQGVQHENLLNVDGFNVQVRFAIPNARSFPSKESTLAGCVSEIESLRRKVQELKLKNSDDSKGALPTIETRAIMMKYLPLGKDKPGFPEMKGVIDVAGWFGRADSFIAKNRIPVDEKPHGLLRETWNRIGEARFPWERYRALDNSDLVLSTRTLGTVSEGVKRFRVFLERRHGDCLKKLDPFVKAYLRDDVFNNPFIARDLKESAAQKAGVKQASVPAPVPGDEIASDPSILVKDDERFTFTWVKWKLLLGGGTDKAGRGDRPQAEDAAAEPLTLRQVADCAQCVLNLGPGYALDRVRITFLGDGNVAGAVLEGLLPVKRVETIKKGADRVH